MVVDAQSCSPGYEGLRCAECIMTDPSVTCGDGVTNGYFRLDQRCEPCPCSVFGFKSYVAGFMLLFCGALPLTDHLHEAEAAATYLSTLTAPFVILLTFVQV